MDEKIFTMIATGLLVVILLILLIVIGRLARIERALRPRADVEETPAETTSDRDDDAPEQSDVAALQTDQATPSDDSADADSAAIEDGPFEKDGRWWFRRGEELLVYNEQTESWVMPDHVDGEPETHPLDAARGWDARPLAEAEPEPVVEPEPEPIVEPEPTVQVATPTTQEETAVPNPEATPATSGSHWKCPACGVINGSTATSCRMCFAARP